MDRGHEPPEDGPVGTDARGARAQAFVARHGRALLVVAGLLAFGVLVAWVLAKTTALIPLADDPFRVRMWETFHGPVRDVALTIATLGDAGIAIVTVSALAAVSYARAGARAAVLPFAAAAVVVFTTLAKDLPGQPTTLPSGHAAYAIAVGGFASWLLLVSGRPRRAAVLFALALLMAPARVIEGAHQPADVIAGVALGIAWLIAVLVLGRPWAAAQTA